MATNQLHDVQRAPTRPPRYLAPSTLDEALSIRAELGARCRPIAGGTDLLVELDRGGHASIEALLDLSRIAGTNAIVEEEDHLRLGAGVTHHDVVASAACQNFVLPLAQACWEIGSPQLRNRATVAGNVITASPANDTISALLALDATIEISSIERRRTLPIGEFVTGFRTVDLADDELVTAIVVPKLAPRQRGIFVKAGLRRAQAISVVHLCVVVDVDDDDVVTDARLALGSVAPTVIVVPGVAEALHGRPIDDDTIAAATTAATSACAPIDDLRATAEYRSAIVATMVTRALRTLAASRHAQRWPSDPPLLRTRARRPSPLAASTALSSGVNITVTVNGAAVTAGRAVGSTLLDWLRDAGILGVKEGCAEGECGACTVHLDGDAVMACLVPAGRADGCDVVTVEGIGDDALAPIQTAMVAAGAVQCGFCTPGFVMSAAALLDEFDHPTPEHIHAGLSGNLCRCTGYRSIVDAIERAAEEAHR